MFEILHVTTVHARYDTRIFVKEACSSAESFESIGLLVADGAQNEIKRGVSIISSKYFVKTLRHLINPLIALFLILTNRRFRSKIYHFHDPELLIVAAILGVIFRGSRVIIDVHESTHEAILNKRNIPKHLRGLIAGIWDVSEVFIVKYFISNVVAATPYIASRYESLASTILVRNYPKVDDVGYIEKTFEYNARNMCYIGNINHMRGVYELLVIWQHLNWDGTLYIIGNFSDADYESKCKELNLGNVEYLGHLDRKRIVPIIAKCSIGVLPFLKGPNHDNAIPNKFFEYMAFGLQVVSNELPLLADLSTEMKIPTVVDVTDVVESSNALNKEISEDLVFKGRMLSKLVWSTYNWNAEWSVLERLYLRSLENTFK